MDYFKITTTEVDPILLENINIKLKNDRKIRVKIEKRKSKIKKGLSPLLFDFSSRISYV